MYIKAILWMASWPVLIIISYQLVKFVVKKYELKEETQEEDSKE